MISTSGFKKGIYILFRDKPHRIVSFSFVSPGKGSAFYRTRLKSLETGAVLEYTFKSGEKMEEVNVDTRQLQFLYRDGESLVFMKAETYEQFQISEEIIDDYSRQFLKEGASYRVQFYEEEAVAVGLPKNLVLEVVKTENSVKGDTVTGALKPATLETGLVVQVPLFVKKGDKISVSTETGAYLSRV